MVEQQMTQQGPPGAGGGEKPVGLSVAAMVLGILSLVTAWPCALICIAGAILGVLATVLGAAALKKNNEGTLGGRGMAIAGLTTGIIGLILSVLWLILIALGLAMLGSAAEQIERDMQNNQPQFQFGGNGFSAVLQQLEMTKVFVSALI